MSNSQVSEGRLNPWQQAIDHELVTAYLGIAKDGVTFEEARRVVGELIDWHVSVAIDPLCNGGYSLQPVHRLEPLNRGDENAF